MLNDKYPSARFIIIGELPPNDIHQEYILKYNTNDFFDVHGSNKRYN